MNTQDVSDRPTSNTEEYLKKMKKRETVIIDVPQRPTPSQAPTTTTLMSEKSFKELAMDNTFEVLKCLVKDNFNEAIWWLAEATQKCVRAIEYETKKE